MPTIDIALAAYNGEKYIADQIQSILSNQINVDGFTLGDIIVSDNMSTDRTREIVLDLARQYPNVKYVPNEKRGVVHNFNYAIQNTTAAYVMLSDQDDIWLENKIALSITKLLELEAQAGNDKPLLVFTDLRVTDSVLNTIHPSFMAYQKIKVDGYRYPKNIFLSNVAPGCTMLINRALINKAIPVPKDAIVHDYWLILVASSFGEVGYVAEQTMLYRQHENNQIGAKTRRYRDLFLSPHLKFKEARSSLENAGTQAKAFLASFPDTPERCLAAIRYLTEFKQMSRFQRVRGLYQQDIENRTFFGTVILYMLALVLPRR